MLRPTLDVTTLVELRMETPLVSAESAKLWEKMEHATVYKCQDLLSLICNKNIAFFHLIGYLMSPHGICHLLVYHVHICQVFS